MAFVIIELHFKGFQSVINMISHSLMLSKCLELQVVCLDYSSGTHDQYMDFLDYL